MSDSPKSSAQTTIVGVADYYAWSADGLENAQREIGEILHAQHAFAARIYEQYGETPSPFEEMDAETLIGVAGLLSFLDRVPDGDVQYQESVLILAIRHDSNNALQRIFSTLVDDNVMRQRIETLFRRFDVMREARNVLLKQMRLKQSSNASPALDEKTE